MTEGEWNTAIAAWFFGAHAAARPVYLSVDDDILADIARQAGWQLDDPVEDFVAAVRKRVLPLNDQPFLYWLQRRNEWRALSGGSPGIPCFIAFLGVTVLAATRERPQNDRGASAYYNPLRQLLGIGGTGTIRGYNPDVLILWEELNRWLKDAAGAHGLPTARSPRTYQSYIGYSLSQAVLLSHERARLTDFFDAIGLEARSEIAPKDLLPRFRRWMAGRVGVTARMRTVLEDPSMAEVLGDIIASELRFWDGSIRDASGHKVGPVLPHIDAYNWRLGTVAFVPAGLAEQIVQIDGTDVELPSGPRFVRFPVPCQLTLGDHLVWSGPTLRFREDIDPVMAFRPNDDVGGWVPVRRAEYGEPHYVLVHNSFKDEVATFFNQTLSQPARETRKIPLPAEWTLFRDVMLSTTHAVVSPALRVLLPRADEMPQLLGGLCLDGIRSLYLDNGAPDVLVPGIGEQMDIFLDSVAIAIVGAAGGLVPLRGRNLEPGAHVVQVGSTTLTFTLLNTRVNWRIEAELAHNLYRVESGYLPERALGRPAAEHGASIAGAAVTSDGHDPTLSQPAQLMIKASTQGYLALGERGFVRKVRVSQPPWATDRQLLFNGFELSEIERQVSFPVLWIARLFQDRAELVWVGQPASGDSQLGADDTAWSAAVQDLRAAKLTVPDDVAEAWSAYASLEDSHA